MKIDIKKSFGKDAEKIKDKKIRDKIGKLVLKLKEIDSISELSNIQSLKGFHNFYRIKLDHNFRIGVFLRDDTLELLRIKQREGFYKSFP